MPSSEASRRGRASRNRGVRFERRIAKKLREAGFECRRVLEYDGWTHGVDLQVGHQYDTGWVDWLPVAIQCKCSKRDNDLVEGLRQAKEGAPSAQLWVCIHSFHKDGARRGVLRILLQAREGNEWDVSWDAFINTFLKPLTQWTNPNLSPA